MEELLLLVQCIQLKLQGFAERAFINSLPVPSFYFPGSHELFFLHSFP